MAQSHENHGHEKHGHGHHERLEDAARTLATPGKGILAADESSGTMGRRLAAIGVESTPDTRRDWRETLFRATTALREHISGVILFDETIRQQARDGTALVDLIRSTGALAGIKVDTGTQPLAGAPGERVTEGLDGLRERLAEYHGLGARFAKWRAVIAIGPGLPGRACLDANAHALARYAALCQEAGLAPIVEPEVMMEGDHSAARCLDAACDVLQAVYGALRTHGVMLEGTILKPAMVLPGTACPDRAAVADVAAWTLLCLRRTVPAAVPGIAFLSGGQDSRDATAHLNAMNAMAGDGAPWTLSFSFGRALQAEPLKTWGGKAENAAAAQAVFTHRVRMNALATLGRWSPEQEQRAA